MAAPLRCPAAMPAPIRCPRRPFACRPTFAVQPDVPVTIMTGSTELGQGSHTVLPQIAAEELGVPFEKVRVISSDTAITPYDRSTGASRTTTLMGSAVLEASRDAIQQMVVMAADVLKVK